MRQKPIRKILLLSVAAVIVYMIAGALVPFWFQPKVGAELKEKFSVTQFYNDKGDSVDRAAVVEDNNDALELRLRIFEDAQEKIILSTFDIRPGGSCTDIFAALLAAAERGVKVQVFVDGLYGAIHMKKEAIFYAVGTHPNVEIRFYNIPNPLMPWTTNGRMHDKYILADDKLLLLGGRNTFDYFLGDYTDKNISYDREILIYNTAAGTEESSESVIGEIQEYFNQIWDLDVCKSVYDSPGIAEKKIEGAKEALKKRYAELKEEKAYLFAASGDYEKDTVPIRKASFLYNPTHIFAKEPYVWYQLTELMKAAKERVYIQTPYAAFSKDMYRDFKDIAQNVTEFDMQINSVAVGDNIMASSDYSMNKKKIRDTGVRIHEFQGDYSSHGKAGLIDDNLSFIGSYNLDMRSTYVDTETVLVIHGEEFNSMLETYIMEMHEESLAVREDGSYEEKDGVAAKELPMGKKILFSITKVVFQLFRYLI